MLETQLVSLIRRWKRITGESGARVGFALLDCRSGKMTGHRREEWFTPASNHKLWVSAAALDRLGPGFRWMTRFGIHDGTLWIQSGGDPVFGIGALDELVERVKSERNTSFSRVLLDDSFFPDERHAPGWSLEDSDAGWAAPVHALNFEFNRIPFAVGGRAGERPVLSNPFPFVRAFADTNRLSFSENGETDIRIRRTGRFRYEISGTVSREEEKIECAVRPGPALFRAALRARLSSAGIGAGKFVTGPVTTGWSESGSVIPSPSLAEVLREVNRESRNLAAEVILRTLGVHCLGRGGVNEGTEAVRTILRKMGVEGPGKMADGSGLSAYNLSSPASLCRLLLAMTRRKDFPVFLDSLAEYGKTGTLKHRRAPFPAGWRILAKTGTLTGVKTLSGYLIRQGTVRAVFSLMIGGMLKEDNGESLQDEWLMKVMAETERQDEEKGDPFLP